MKRMPVLLLLLFFNSCQINRQNNAEDIDDAKKIADKFYSYLRAHNIEEASKLFGGAATPEGAIQTFHQTDSIMGNFSNYTIKDVNTSILLKSGKKTGNYIITVSSTYEKGNLDEELNVVIDGDSYHIDGYHVTKTIEN